MVVVAAAVEPFVEPVAVVVESVVAAAASSWRDASVAVWQH